MRAGRMRHRIELQQPTVSKDSFGQDVNSFSTIATVWGAIEPITGNEKVERDIQYSELDAKVIIRYSSGITTKYRLKHGSIIYEIKNILMTNMIKRELILLIKEVETGAV